MNRPIGSTNWYGHFYDSRRRPRVRHVKLKAHTEEAARQEYDELKDRWALGDFNPWKKHRTPKRRPGKGNIYVVRCSGFNLFKVGYATGDFAGRLAQMQTNCPFELLVHRRLEVKQPIAVERKLHEALADYHLRGEWFELSEARLSEILIEVLREIRTIVSTQENGQIHNEA